MSNYDGYNGTQQPGHATDEYNAMAFVIQQILNGRNHVALVQVISVTTAGGLALAGTVDVKPLVNQLDGYGNAVAHGVVNDIPYVRVQGGSNAVIIDPEVGDIGICVFCDRDISAVQATRAAANPGSFRRSDMADGVYLGGLLNGIPNQYVMFGPSGIKMVSPANITLQAPKVEINASASVTITTPLFTVNGASQFNGDVSGTTVIKAPLIDGTTDVKFGGKSSVTHTHGGVATGTFNTGGPT